MSSEKVAICPLLNFQISEIVARGSRNGRIVEYFAKGEERIKKGIEILDTIRIRRIKVEDINKIKQFPAVGLLGLYERYFSSINQRTFVIEFLGKDDNDFKYIEKEIGKILLAMRLYKPISVFCKIIWFIEKDETKSTIILDSPLPRIEEMLFSHDLLRFDELEKIVKIVKKIDRIDFDERKSFRIACERFNRTFEKYKEDEIIIDLIIAFEALLLRGKKVQSNIGQFIGLGCSMLLGKDDKERNEISEFVVKAYEIRNKIVHGAEYEIPIQMGNRKYAIHDFILQLQKYLSESMMRLI